MIHPDEALKIVLSCRQRPQVETVPLDQALGRVLAAPVASSMDQPPFSKAAVDGWAWNSEASGLAPDSLAVRNVIAAGESDQRPLGAGETVKVMTGAPLPPGADRIQKVECAQESDGAVRFTKPERIDNVIQRGENARTGDTIVSPRQLDAQDLAILAADGRNRVDVAVRPVVGILSTGAELAQPGENLKPGWIYDSNRTQLAAHLSGIAVIRDFGTLPDDYDATLAAVGSALSQCDVLVLSGGVSMGDYDYVPKALTAAGVQTLFHGVAVKPGKPTFFGTSAKSYVFGLPGNPVSVFVNTEFLVKPLLYGLQGVEYRGLSAPVTLSEGIRRGSTERVEFLPVSIDADGAKPVPYGGSSALQALAHACGFVRLEQGQKEISAGSVVHVRLVR